jgi:hypothetical protein
VATCSEIKERVKKSSDYYIGVGVLGVADFPYELFLKIGGRRRRLGRQRRRIFRCKGVILSVYRSPVFDRRVASAAPPKETSQLSLKPTSHYCIKVSFGFG